jgi:pimeloyl-ACP methyl ester carboxylesterase
VVAWDAPGCGGSDDPPETFRLPDYADCLAGVAAALGIGRPHVCGLSFGGGLALELYRRHPGLPRSLVLASAYAGWAGSLPPEVVRERLDQVMREAELPPERWVRGYLPGLFTEAAPRALLEEAEAIMLDARPAGMRAMALSFAEADLRDLLPGIRVPTLLLYGDVDRRSPQAASPPSCTAASRDRGWWSCQGSGMPPTWRPPIASTPRCASSCAPFRKLRGWTRER